MRYVQRLSGDHIALCGGHAKITDEVMQYYGETPLPTNGIDKAFTAGWVPKPIAPKR